MYSRHLMGDEPRPPRFAGRRRLHSMIPTAFTTDDRSQHGNAPTHFVLGGGHVGTAVANALREADRSVVLIDESPNRFDGRTIEGDPRNLELLEAAGLSAASTVVVATRSDSRNLLVAQLARVRFDVPETVVLVNVPDRLDVVADAGHEPVCATSALSDALELIV